MARGNGKHAQNALRSGKLSAFVSNPTGNGATATGKEYVDWSEVEASLVFGAVAGVVKHGGALLLGCSSNKSSYSLKVYSDGQGQAYYFPCTESGLRDLEAFLSSLADLYLEPLD